MLWRHVCRRWRSAASVAALAAPFSSVSTPLNSSRPLQQIIKQSTQYSYAWLGQGLSTLPSGPSSNETRSSLQQRLAEAGVADWRAFSQPRYSKLTSTADIESAAVKIVELCREGLTAEGVERLFHQERGPWTSDLQEVFLPNMAYLRGLLRNVTFVQAPYEPAALTPLGRLVRNQPSDMGRVLSRSPALIEAVEAWICGELELPHAQLVQAVLKSPSILRTAVGTASDAFSYLTGELGISVDQSINMLLKCPGVFRVSRTALARKCSWLAQTFSLLSVEAVKPLVVKCPVLLYSELSHVPATLCDLNVLLGRKGAGIQLAMKAPRLALCKGFQFRRTLEALMNFGYSVDAARVVVVQNPELLYQDLGGPVQQQKLQWVRETLGWPVTKLLSENLFGRNLRRMASRLSFVRHLGLPNPGSLAYIGIASEPVFLARVGKAAGREVSAGDFAEWVAAWLQTPEGQRWGFKPQSSR